jgi:hypothetical protein
MKWKKVAINRAVGAGIAVGADFPSIFPRCEPIESSPPPLDNPFAD